MYNYIINTFNVIKYQTKDDCIRRINRKLSINEIFDFYFFYFLKFLKI